MPNIDLEPHEYSRPHRRSGKMVRDFSPKWARNWLFVCLPVLGLIFINRDQFTTDILFGVTAMFAFFAGGFFANWLKNIY